MAGNVIHRFEHTLILYAFFTQKTDKWRRMPLCIYVSSCFFMGQRKLMVMCLYK